MNKKITYKVSSALAITAVLLSPVMAGAAQDTSTVQTTVNSVISVESAATVLIPAVTPDADGEISSASDTITVNSNDPDGYDLTVENDATLTMTGSDGGTLAKTAGTYGTPAALSANSWGYRLSGFTVDTYAGVEQTPQNIKSTAAVANNDTTSITYGVNVNTSVPAGVYTDSVTYTATVKE